MPKRDTDTQIAHRIEQDLIEYTNRTRREFMSGGYAPSQLQYIGATVPQLRQVVRKWSHELKSTPGRKIVNIALVLTRSRTVEGRQVGYELIARRRDAMALLTPDLVRALGRGNDNWASVDGFATYISGPAWRLGLVPDRAALEWASSTDQWWRRTALASTVALNVAARGGRGDTRRTLMICRCFTRDTDPMLAKALSWALRSLVPHDAPAVQRFLDTYATLPALVRREVTTKLRTGRKSPKRASQTSTTGSG